MPPLFPEKHQDAADAVSVKVPDLQGAAMLLAEPEKSIAQVAADCGFDSPSNFSMMFRRFYGQAPREYRRGQKGGRRVGAEKLQPACPPGD